MPQSASNPPPPTFSPGEYDADEAGAGFSLRQKLGIPLAAIAFAAVYLPCDFLSPEGRPLAGILAAVATLWMSEAIPLPAAALLGAVLCVVCGVADAKTVLAYFADPIVFVFLGGFMLARAMSVHGLDRRLAIGLLSWPAISASPARILAAVGAATGLISMWVSNTATTAMMLPIALGVLRAMHESRVARGEVAGAMDVRRWPYAAAMMLMVAYGASIGGLGTPVGTPPNLIGIGLIRKTIGVDISFFRWMALALPLLAVMGAVLVGLLWFMYRRDERAADRAAGRTASHATIASDQRFLHYIHNERARLGPWSRGELNTLFAFFVAITLWVLPGVLELPWFDAGPVEPLREWLKSHLPESIVALIAAVLLFLLPIDWKRGQFTLTWREAERIDWGTILLFGGGMALGSLMFATGVADALGRGMARDLGIASLWGLTAWSIAIAIIISEAASNTASANMIIPVAIAVAQSAGVSPLPPALGACLGASFGFMLPVSTPPNAIVYGSGLVPLRSMIRAGIWFDVVGFAIIWIGLRVLCPVLGLM